MRNGTGWKQVPSPTPAGGRPVLRRVGGLKQRPGGRLYQQLRQDLILHWNGTAWK
jgi:hypothetical protein